MILKTFLTGEAAMATPPADTTKPAPEADGSTTALEAPEALTIDDLAAASRVPYTSFFYDCQQKHQLLS